MHFLEAPGQTVRSAQSSPSSPEHPEASAQELIVDQRIAALQDTLQKRLEALGIQNAQGGQCTPVKKEMASPPAPPSTPRRKTVDQRLAEMEAWVTEIQARPQGPVPLPMPEQLEVHDEPQNIIAEAAAACKLSLEAEMETSPAPAVPVPVPVPVPAPLLPGFGELLKPLPAHPNFITGSPARKKSFKLVERPDAPPPGAIHLVVNSKGRMEDQAGEEVSSVTLH